ncbi:MAG: hypothetical protein ACRDIC_11295 [bacterium]
MRKAVVYLRTHPVMALLIVAGIAAVVMLVILPQRSPSVQTTEPPVAPVASTPPAAAPAPAPASPAAPGVSPAAPTVAATPAPGATPKAGMAPKPGAVDAGRPDPFGPLVRPAAPGGGGAGLPPLPPAPLPPPLFPGQQPGQPGAAPPAPKEASGAALVGLIGDGGAVAIIKIGKDTFIVVPGDVISGKIRVEVIDVSKRLVILEQEGERFELKMGGVSGPHVAAAASSHFN